VLPTRLLQTLLLAAAIAFLATGPAGARPAPLRAPTAIFYYPWYGTPDRDGSYGHWADGGHVPPADLASNFYPDRGVYSSTDPAVLKAQMADIAGAGINEVVVSWWGWGSAEDQHFPAVAAAARKAGLLVAVHLEPYGGRSAESVESDVAHLQTLGVNDFYVYRPFQGISVSDWSALLARLPDVKVYAQTDLVGAAAAAGFDGVYTYDVLTHDGPSFRRICNQAHVAGLLCAPSVGPGFDARRAVGIPRVKARRGGLTYDSMWRGAIAAQADIITITSYNEWEEGTQIEPARIAPRTAGGGYDSYTGAWGLQGAKAPGAYLARTAYWTQRYGLKPGLARP
jgi:glycoprotein endo-alpha-1,2-mannosidase